MKWISSVSIAAFVVLLSSINLAAQSDEMFDKASPYIGNWGVNYGVDGQDRGNCGGWTGEGGEKLLNCQIPAHTLPLNARGKAWMEFVDHRMSPGLNDCAPGVIPSLLGDSGRWYLSGRENEIVIYYSDIDWTRHVWMDGRKPPLQAHLFQHGYSVGHWDGNDLVIESTNYAFDPEGIDDHLHMASSVLKKITERYHLMADDMMRLTITIDDPIFLTRPFTYALIEYKRQGGANPGWLHCDPGASRREVEYGYPGNKYDLPPFPEEEYRSQ